MQKPNFIKVQPLFYRQDPANYGPLKVITYGQRVNAFSTYKEMELEFDVADLCTAGAIADDIENMVTVGGDAVREKISARLSCLVAAARDIT
jgi:hypothetical protein